MPAHGRHDGHDARQGRRLLLTDGPLARRLIDAQELEREGGEVLRRVRGLDARPVVHHTGELVRVVVPQVRHKAAQLVEPRALLGGDYRHVAPALEENEDVVGRHVRPSVDSLDVNAALLGVEAVLVAQVVQGVPPQVLVRDAFRRPSAERTNGNERKARRRRVGPLHDGQRELHVVVPAVQRKGASSA